MKQSLDRLRKGGEEVSKHAARAAKAATAAASATAKSATEATEQFQQFQQKAYDSASAGAQRLKEYVVYEWTVNECGLCYLSE